MDQEPIIWETFEYEPRKRSSDWYWAVAIITIAVAAIAIFFGDFLFGILVVIAAAILCLYAARPPLVLTCEVSKKGVVVEKRLHPYDTLESFWIEDDDVVNPKLIIKSKKLFVPYIVIPLHDDLDRQELRMTLKKNIKESFHEEPLAHKLIEFIGF